MIKQSRISLMCMLVLILSIGYSFAGRPKPLIPQMYCPTPPKSTKLVERCIEDTFLSKRVDELEKFALAKNHLGDMHDCHGSTDTEYAKTYFSEDDFVETVNGAEVDRCEYNSSNERFSCYVDLKKHACATQNGRWRKTTKAKIIVSRETGYLLSFYPVAQF